MRDSYTPYRHQSMGRTAYRASVKVNVSRPDTDTVTLVPARSLVLAASVAALAAGGCGGGDPADLRNAATSLTPPGAHIVSEEEGHCVDLASSPSCYDVYVEPRPQDQRIRVASAHAAAERGGWELSEEIHNRRSVRLVFLRGDFVGNVRLVDEARAQACAQKLDPACSDWIHVLRSG